MYGPYNIFYIPDKQHGEYCGNHNKSRPLLRTNLQNMYQNLRLGPAILSPAIFVGNLKIAESVARPHEKNKSSDICLSL